MQIGDSYIGITCKQIQNTIDYMLVVQLSIIFAAVFKRESLLKGGGCKHVDWRCQQPLGAGPDVSAILAES